MAALRSFKTIAGPLQLLLLSMLFLQRDLDVRGNIVAVTQLPDIVSVTPGETITLQCTLTVALPVSVLWYKGLDRNQPPIYSNNQGASNRGVRVSPESDMDFSINVQNVLPEDAGTYYCVLFWEWYRHQGKELASGNGTLVSVIASSSQINLIIPCMVLFLSKAAIIFFIFSFLLIKKIGCNSQNWRSFLHEKRNVFKEKPSPVTF